jgi:hypothetical protein
MNHPHNETVIVDGKRSALILDGALGSVKGF